MKQKIEYDECLNKPSSESGLNKHVELPPMTVDWFVV